jgi:hypothetical protein
LSAHRARQEDIQFVDIADGVYYESICSKGHKNVTILAIRKFEVLFEFGAMALLDGYTREAVSSFAVALERFYEYWLKAQLLHAGTAPDRLEMAWKAVAAQSERQLGAFTLLYLREYGTPAPLLPQSNVEFRNKVIHKGYIPTRMEASTYGDAVLQHMAGLYKELYTSRRTAVSALDGLERAKVLRSADRRHLSNASIATVFAEAAGPAGTALDKALHGLQERMELIYKR